MTVSCPIARFNQRDLNFQFVDKSMQVMYKTKSVVCHSEFDDHVLIYIFKVCYEVYSHRATWYVTHEFYDKNEQWSRAILYSSG